MEETKENKNIWKTIQSFLMKSTNGMALGLFGTLIIGTIIGTLGNIIPLAEISGPIKDFSTLLKGLMGAGIGLGVALSLGLEGVGVVAVTAGGAVGVLGFGFGLTSYSFVSNSDPLSCYCSAIISYFAIKLILRKKTPVDLIIIPLVALLSSLLYCFFLSYWVHQVTVGVQALVEFSFEAIPLIMCVIVSVLVGMALTMPISSVAICVAIGIESTPLAAGAALIGCCTQMVGFAVQATHDNKWGNVLAIGIGTSMLEFKNIIKNPLIWLPTIITSAILGPFAYVFGLTTDSVGAGMGTSGFVGLLNTFNKAGWNGITVLETIIICVIVPAIIVFLLDLLFRKVGLIKKGDLSIEEQK